MLLALGLLASSASLIVNGPKAWPTVKHAAHEGWCMASTMHRCAKQTKDLPAVQDAGPAAAKPVPSVAR